MVQNVLVAQRLNVETGVESVVEILRLLRSLCKPFKVLIVKLGGQEVDKEIVCPSKVQALSRRFV